MDRVGPDRTGPDRGYSVRSSVQGNFIFGPRSGPGLDRWTGGPNMKDDFFFPSCNMWHGRARQHGTTVPKLCLVFCFLNFPVSTFSPKPQSRGPPLPPRPSAPLLLHSPLQPSVMRFGVFAQLRPPTTRLVQSCSGLRCSSPRPQPQVLSLSLPLVSLSNLSLSGLWPLALAARL